MHHNLFDKPTECSVIINSTGYELQNIDESPNIIDILQSIHYDSNTLLKILKKNLQNSSFTHEKEKSDTLSKLKGYLYQNGYLRTTK